MKKILSFCAAILLTIAVNAASNIHINPGTNTLRSAYISAESYSTIYLADGTYDETAGYFDMYKPVTIQAEEGAHPVVHMSHYFKVYGNNAKVTFKGIKIDGTNQDASYTSLFKFDGTNTSDAITLEDCEICNCAHDVILCPNGTKCYFINLKNTTFHDIAGKAVNFANQSMSYLRMDGCVFSGFSQKVIYGTALSHMDSCIVNNCYFHDCTNSAIYFSNTTETGKHACSKLHISNSTFANFTGFNDPIVAFNTYNGPANITGAELRVDHCTFYNHAKIDQNLTYGCVDSRTATNVIVSNCIFAHPDANNQARATQLYGGTVTNCLLYNAFHRTDDITLVGGVTADPQFENAAAANYRLAMSSPALRAATDGTALGDPFWWPEFYVYGSMNETAWTLGADKMTLNSATSNYSRQYELAAGTYQFKINNVNGTAEWNHENILNQEGLSPITLVAGDATGHGNNISLTTDGRPFTIYFNLATNKVWASYNYALTVDLLGGFTSWTTNPIAMEISDDHTYCTATVYLTPDDYVGDNGFKVRVDGNSKWFGAYSIIKRALQDASRTRVLDDPNNNCGLRVDIEGDYTFKFVFATQEMTVTYPYSFTREITPEQEGKFQTLCTPYTSNITNAEVYYVNTVDLEHNTVRLTSTSASGTSWGASFLIKPTGGDITISMPGGACASDPRNPENQNSGLYGVLGASYVYNYNGDDPYGNPNSQWSVYVLQDDNMFHLVGANSTATIASTRAYLHVKGVPASSAPIRIVMENENATNIDNIEAGEQAVKFIENGQLFIRKNGVVYDALGAVVK